MIKALYNTVRHNLTNVSTVTCTESYPKNASHHTLGISAHSVYSLMTAFDVIFGDLTPQMETNIN